MRIPVMAHCERGLEKSAQLDCWPAGSALEQHGKSHARTGRAVTHLTRSLNT